MSEKEILECIKRDGTRASVKLVLKGLVNPVLATVLAELLTMLESQRVIRRGSIVDMLYRLQGALTK